MSDRFFRPYYGANCSWSVNYPFLSHRGDSKTDNSQAPLYCWRICCTTVFTTLDGIAKLTPLAVVLVSVLTAPRVGMPMSCPCKLTRAPPLLPGFKAASVWMALERVVPADSVTLRLRALTMPWVAVSVIPNGLPTARTSCPTTSLEESPSWATVICAKGAMRTTARSFAAFVPISCACSVLPLDRRTSMLCSPLTTWLLVTMSPFESIMTPEPICPPCAVVTLSSTTAGSIVAMAASCWDCIDVPVDEEAVDVATAFVVVLALLLLCANSQPENRPTLKMRASTSVRSMIAPGRPRRFRGGIGGETTGPGG